MDAPHGMTRSDVAMYARAINNLADNQGIDPTLAKAMHPAFAWAGGNLVERFLDAMLHEHRRQVLGDAIEAVIQAAPSLNSELRYDGSTDPVGAAYVEGFHDAWEALDALRRGDSPATEMPAMVRVEALVNALATIEANDSTQSGDYGCASRDAVDLISRRVLNREWPRG